MGGICARQFGALIFVFIVGVINPVEASYFRPFWHSPTSAEFGRAGYLVSVRIGNPTNCKKSPPGAEVNEIGSCGRRQGMATFNPELGIHTGAKARAKRLEFVRFGVGIDESGPGGRVTLLSDQQKGSPAHTRASTAPTFTMSNRP